MSKKSTGVQKILWQPDLIIENEKTDVLIPLPANADACLESIGINDFEDRDEQWDKDFLTILYKLTDETKSKIEVYNPLSKKKDNEFHYSLSDIPTFLSQVDHLNIRITNGNKVIIFSNGHEIFWLRGFSSSEIESLGFPFVRIENKKLAKIF